MDQTKRVREIAVVVEDDAFQREMVALLLEESEFDVIQFADAETAFLEIKARHPMLLIADVNLTARMNGVEPAHLAQQQNPKMRIIVVSGNPPTSSLRHDPSRVRASRR